MPFRESVFRAENKQFSTESKIEENVEKYKERIEDAAWRPSIFDEFRNTLGIGASTKELKRLINKEEVKI